ncbi:MAG: hypothetical protein HY293_04095 [Planctomycetes bacterium]|nr:hypothetical protein [Planctomycetota bacterium]
MDSSRARSQDRLATAVVWSVAALVTGGFAWLLGDIVWHGAGRISWDFLFSLPRNAGREGGLAPILAATFLILLVCMAASLPLGVGTAVLLAEFSGEGLCARFVRRSLDVLAGIPSIVFGLFGNAFFCKALGMGFSILAGGLTLACMVLPILIRATRKSCASASLQSRLCSRRLA